MVLRTPLELLVCFAWSSNGKILWQCYNKALKQIIKRTTDPITNNNLKHSLELARIWIREESLSYDPLLADRYSTIIPRARVGNELAIIISSHIQQARVE